GSPERNEDHRWLFDLVGAGLNLAVLPPGVGVGGQVLVRGRPVIADVRNSRRQPGRSDWAGTEEGIRAVAAVPVRRAGAIWAVMYAATRSRDQIGSAVSDTFVEMARAFERFLAYHSGGARGDTGGGPYVRPPAPALETLLQIEAELEGLTDHAGDQVAVRERVASIRQLLQACYGYMDGATDREPAFGLTPRELEVVRFIAEGHSNAEAAKHLTVKPETVKSYLRSIMQKLGVHNRTAAVNVARRAGLLP
ncbi:response regulator transcription factor, partial [Frankia sp. AgB1.9]|uniref:helix-turn-helix transcriptional regulator n=1 Tax=Frankia sp. AgB1.9 TaxID=1836968 RepID=UPI00193413D4